MAKKTKDKDIKKAVMPKSKPDVINKDIMDMVDFENYEKKTGELHPEDPRAGDNMDTGKAFYEEGDKTVDSEIKRLTELAAKRKKFSGKQVVAAKGGSMPKQMEMFAEGGLKQEGGSVDPVSGNDVPVGSTKEEVRDDIPAQLSEGEFVMPADVVRFHGLDKMMELRDQAKMGLKKMEAMGQMGNSEEATLPDDVPFNIDDLDTEDEPIEMAEGGIVQAANGTFVNPSTGIGGYQQSQFANYTPQFTPYTAPTQLPTTGYIAPQQQTTPLASQQTLPKFEDVIPAPEGKYDEIIEYVNAEGLKLSIPFVNGKPIYPIPTGYKRVDTGVVAPDPITQVPTAKANQQFDDRELSNEATGDNRTPQEIQADKERMAQISARTARAKELGYKPANPITSILGMLTPLGMLGVGKTPGTIDGAGNVIGQDGRTFNPITGKVASSGSIYGDVFNSLTGKDISNTTTDGTQIQNNMVTPMTAGGMKQYTPQELMSQITDAQKSLDVAKAEVTKSQFGMGLGAGIDSANVSRANVLGQDIRSSSQKATDAEITDLASRERTQYDMFGNVVTASTYDKDRNPTELATPNRNRKDLAMLDAANNATSRRGANDGRVGGPPARTETRDPMQSPQSQSFNDNAREDVENHGGSKGIGRNDNGSTYSVNNDGTFTHENGTTVNFTGTDGKPGNPPSDESISGAPSKGTPADQGLGSINTDGDDGQPSDGCVIATHGVSTGGFTIMEKAKAELWCQKTYHGKWYGEAFRKGYRAAGIKQVNAGTAPNVYQEFKDFVAYGRGIKKGWKAGFNYYFRTLQFFFTGLFIK